MSARWGGRDAAEGQRLFDALAEVGTVTMPFADTIWGATFEMLTDKCGTRWMLNFESAPS